MKPHLVIALSSGFAMSCVTTAPPHVRAVEANDLCAHYIGTGDLQTAEDQCDLGLQFSPQYADLWANKGVIAFQRGQDEKAKEFLIKALRLNQNLSQAYNNLGMIYAKELKQNTAADNFRAALRVNPDYPDARYNLALAYMALNQNEKAKKELRTLVEIKPELADGWAQLGQIAVNEGENETAVALFTKATQLDPKFASAWLMLGNAYMESGKPCEGKDAYSTCIETDEANAQCRNNIIVAEKKCALLDRAMVDVKERQAGTRTPQSEYSAALQYKEKGLVNDEERAYKRCLKYDPKFVLCHYGLFELYKDRSDSRNATIACKNFLKYASESDFATQVSACQQYVQD